MRFSLVDRILAMEPGRSIRTTKNPSLAEEYLADHFPGFPVMPGVLMIESLVQAGAWLMRETEGFAYSTILLKEVKAVKFNNFVKPGHSLAVECEITKREGNLYTFKGTGTVDGASAVSAKITLEQFNLADRNADLRKSDELRIAKLRELYACLWTATSAS